MILSAQSIQYADMIEPFHMRTVKDGMSFGLGPASYDVRIAQDVFLDPGEFKLASIMEHLTIPDYVSVSVADKSTWARRGLSVFNTFIDPGWQGYLTVELMNNSLDRLYIHKGMPIAQLIFSQLDKPTMIPYRGKYYNQPNRPVEPIEEEDYV